MADPWKPGALEAGPGETSVLLLTNSEWLTHQHRDTLASIVGHPPLLAYISIADGECLARERFEVIEVSLLALFLFKGSHKLTL